MKKSALLFAAVAALTTLSVKISAQHSHASHDKGVKLHVNPRWDECSFQLDPGLTQQAWRQFTQEAGLVAYFRPLNSAQALGRGHFELAALSWRTAFDDTDAAWNDTFVHPDSTHWLKDGARLPFPGLTARVGITNKLDAGIYFTKNPQANYGFWGAQLQYNLVHNEARQWSVAARAHVTSLFGPADLTLNTYGLEAVVSKEWAVYSDWLTVSPYLGVSTYMAHARETTEAVNLKDETRAGLQTMAGVAAHIYFVSLGLEYNVAQLQTVSFKVGVTF